MAQLNTMEYKAEFQRGWPVAQPTSQLNLSEEAGYSATNGDLVVLKTDGTIEQTSGADAAGVGIVVRGSADYKSGGSPVPAIVLMGNYVVRTTNVTAGAAALNVGQVVGSGAAGQWDAPAATPVAGSTYGTIVAKATVTDVDGSAATALTIAVS